jgi:hypothetical protein
MFDGAKWVAQPGTGIAYLPVSGGTLTGPLVLAADPTAALGAATKQYADAGSAAAEHNVGRSYIHNGLMNVAQRGAGPFTAAAYTVDRWSIYMSSDTLSVSQFIMADTARSQIGDEAATHGLNVVFTGSAVASAESFLLQRIEDVRRLGGKTVTVSFYAAATVAGLKLGCSLYQSFGTGGSPSAGGYTASQAVTLTTAYVRYSLTFTLPSTAGQTLGTNGDSSTSPVFWFSSGSTNNANAGNIGVQSGTINLWGVQLEIGPTATPLEKLDPQQDLAKCQRFYQTGQVAFASYAGAAGMNAYATAYPPVIMRASPTITTAANNCFNFGTLSWSPNALIFTLTGVAPAIGAFSINANFIASADL